jgi:hypothetical protein
VFVYCFALLRYTPPLPVYVSRCLPCPTPSLSFPSLPWLSLSLLDPFPAGPMHTKKRPSHNRLERFPCCCVTAFIFFPCLCCQSAAPIERRFPLARPLVNPYNDVNTFCAFHSTKVAYFRTRSTLAGTNEHFV